MGRLLSSVRVRTTLGAVLVVAVALGLAAVVLVGLLRDSLRDGLEASAEERAAALAAEVERAGVPTDDDQGDRDGDDDGDRGGRDDSDDSDDADDPEDLVLQVADEESGEVRYRSGAASALPLDDTDLARLPGADHAYLVVTDDAEHDDVDYVVSAAVSTEEVDDSTTALLPPLALVFPLVLLVVGGVTWVVVSRALRPVEQIRAEVAGITDDRLDRRVPVPATRDELHRLALTMNAMLERLDVARTRQQRFVADASHELRSPLASLRQTGEVAQAHPGALGEGELAETVIEESVRMQHLVEQLLVLTRSDAGRALGARRDVDLDDVVRSEAGRVRRAGSRPDVRLDTREVAAARTTGDPQALAQVVRNLLDNAVRHADHQVRVGVRAEGAWALVVVDDDGRGVPPAERQRVFERFVRLDEARARDDGGSGLGLAIVAAIVQAHGGTVGVDDGPLGGACFTVALPA